MPKFNDPYSPISPETTAKVVKKFANMKDKANNVSPKEAKKILAIYNKHKAEVLKMAQTQTSEKGTLIRSKNIGWCNWFDNIRTSIYFGAGKAVGSAGSWTARSLGFKNAANYLDKKIRMGEAGLNVLVTQPLSQTLNEDPELQEAKIKIYYDALTKEEADALVEKEKGMTIWKKMYDFCMKMYRHIKRGFLYAAIFFFAFAILLVLGFILSGGKITKFTRVVSDIFHEVISKIKKTFLAIGKGIITLSPKSIYTGVISIYKDFIKKMKEIFNEIKLENLELAIIGVSVATLLSGGCIILYAKDYVDGLVPEPKESDDKGEAVKPNE